jgi:integrase
MTGQGKNLIQFAFWTGLRTSELVALNWKEIDFLRGVVCVTTAITQKAKQAEKTKTTAGQREVKLLTSTLEALANQKPYTYLGGEEVFQNPNTHQPIRKTLWQCDQEGKTTLSLSLSDPTYVRQHDAIGWRASDVGGKPDGHKDWKMIARRYGRWIPDADVLAGSGAEALYGSPLVKSLHESEPNH